VISTLKLDLAASVADGTPLDWERLESQSTDPAHRAFVRRLRLVERIATVHRGRPESTAPPTESPRHTAPITAWGPFTGLEKVGRGTFGDVYRALDPRLDRPVALKLLRRRETNPDADSAVIEEARLMAKVRHPHVVTIHGAERIDGRVGLWMEFVDGRTLEDELRQLGSLDADNIAAIGRDLSGALAAVHHAGLLHRDLKAQNVIRDREGHVRLTDFGTGLHVSGGSDPDTSHGLAGTPLYLAPEVVRGRAATTRSDIYSLGVLLYHLATGSFPVRGRSLDELRELHARAARPRVRDVREDLPTKLANAIDRACSPDPADRYVTATEFQAALQEREPRRMLLVLSTAAVVLLSVAVAGLTVRTLRPPTNPPTAGVAAATSRIQILLTRFDNRTGEPGLDGSIAGALEREFTRSTIATVVTPERIADTLRSMQRPPGTVVDAALGREVALRHGGIGAIVSGRIEKEDETYRVTAQLVEVATGRIIQTAVETAREEGAVLAALGHAADSLREALSDGREAIAASTAVVEPVTTRSLKAFQLYNQASGLGRNNQWDAAEVLARQAVEEDQDFAVGWTFLAWTIRRARLDLTPIPARHDPRLPAIHGEMRPLLDRAMRLTSHVSEWERYWIEASYYTLTDNDEESVPRYEALLKVRPDHLSGANNLGNTLLRLGRLDALLRMRKFIADARPTDAASNFQYASEVVFQRRDAAAAKPYLERVMALTPSDHPQHRHYAVFVEWLPMFTAWDAGNVKATLALTEAAVERALNADGDVRLSQAAGFFNLALGRLREARRLFEVPTNVPGFREVSLLALADISNDREELAERSSTMVGAAGGASGPTRFSLLVRGGFVERARALLTMPRSATIGRECWSPACDGGFFELGVGEVMHHDGRNHEAIPHLERGLALTKGSTYREYYQGCDVLAAAYQRVKRQDDALRNLERCAAERPPFHGAPFGTPAFWMRLKLHLADDYRMAGQEGKARAIEDELRRLLVYADEDHPFVRRLGR